jgi:D-3-phosphoglycerate dehydrogenase
VRGTAPDGQLVSVSGTLSGLRQTEHLVEVNGFDAELAPADHMIFLGYADRPGVVGTVGQVLGGQWINIAGMQVCRHAQGGGALMVLTVDSAVHADLLSEIAATIGAGLARVVDLDEV